MLIISLLGESFCSFIILILISSSFSGFISFSSLFKSFLSFSFIITFLIKVFSLFSVSLFSLFSSTVVTFSIVVVGTPFFIMVFVIVLVVVFVDLVVVICFPGISFIIISFCSPTGTTSALWKIESILDILSPKGWIIFLTWSVESCKISIFWGCSGFSSWIWFWGLGTFSESSFWGNWSFCKFSVLIF